MSSNITDIIMPSLGNPLLAIETRMGQRPAYIASAPLYWVAEHVHFAGEMPIFGDFVNSASRRIKVNEVTIEHILQRRPDWSRQLRMSAYLSAWDNRKFPTLMVVGYQDWAHNKNSKKWRDRKAICSTVIPLNSPLSGAHELDVDETKFYALDGQHRLMALKGMSKFIFNEKLPACNRRGDVIQEVGLSFRDIAESVKRQSERDLTDEEVKERLKAIMMKERVGMEIIPAVAEGERQEDATLRLRGIFVDVNENAKTPTRGESILLDEKNGFRVVARHVMMSHSLLKNRVEMQGNRLAETDENYTTLDAIAQIATAYLGSGDFSDWKIPLIARIRETGYIRPKGGEKEIQRGIIALCAYFDQMKQLPSHQRMMNGTSSAPDFRTSRGENNILFRPVGQIALAEAVSSLVHTPKNRMTLAEIFRKLRHQETRKQLQLHNPTAPWHGVAWDPAKKKMLMGKVLCRRLFFYLLGGKLTEKKLDKLQEDFFKSRQGYREHRESDNFPARW